MQIIINLLFLFFGFFLIKKNQKRYLSKLNHLNIFGIVWPFITIGTQLVYPGALSIETVVFYYFCWLSYIFGSSLIHHKQNVPLINNSFVKIKVLTIVLLIFCVISNFELLALILKTGNLLSWAALRKENGFEELESSIFITLFQRAYLIYISLGILLLKHNQISKTKLILLIFTGLIFSVLRFTRAPLLNLFIVLLVSYVYIYKKKLPVFYIFISVCLVFLAFGGSMLILTQGTNNYNVFDDIKLYLFGGQVVYQNFLEGNYVDNLTYDVNNYTFDFVNYFLKKIDLIQTYPSYVREYSYRSGVLTNIYTFLDCFTYDFGIIGAIIGSFFTGFFSDYIYEVFNRKKNVFALIFYGYVCYYNCFVFANNEFVRFSVLLTGVSMIVYSFLTKQKSYGC